VSSALLRALRFMRSYRLTAAAAVLAVLAASVADLVSPQILRMIIDRGIAGEEPDIIWQGALGLVFVAVLGGLASFLQGFLSAKASHGAAFDMRNAIFDKLQRLSFSYHDRASTGQLITRVTSDVDLVREFVGGGLVQAVSAVLLLIGAVILLLSMNTTLALVAFTVVPGTLAVLLLFVRRLGPMFRQFQKRLGALNTVLQENIAGARVVRAFAREDFEATRYQRGRRSASRARALRAPYSGQRVPPALRRGYARRRRGHDRRGSPDHQRHTHRRRARRVHLLSLPAPLAALHHRLRGAVDRTGKRECRAALRGARRAR
jgi:ABC-type multidrug transport system fused ATPase/permease subunit